LPFLEGQTSSRRLCVGPVFSRSSIFNLLVA
jgi:hypothetical protein